MNLHFNFTPSKIGLIDRKLLQPFLNEIRMFEQTTIGAI